MATGSNTTEDRGDDERGGTNWDAHLDPFGRRSRILRSPTGRPRASSVPDMLEDSPETEITQPGKKQRTLETIETPAKENQKWKREPTPNKYWEQEKRAFTRIIAAITDNVYALKKQTDALYRPKAELKEVSTNLSRQVKRLNEEGIKRWLDAAMSVGRAESAVAAPEASKGQGDSELTRKLEEYRNRIKELEAVCEGLREALDTQMEALGGNRQILALLDQDTDRTHENLERIISQEWPQDCYKKRSWARVVH